MKNTLSARELEVMRQLADDVPQKRVALNLGITHETVKSYTKLARRKLGVSSAAGAVAALFRDGVIR